MNENNKRIVRNTMFLYIRMFLTLGISLYTSRVILESLGITDYGIYQSVGGIVGLLSFITGALSVASSRYITYEIGRNDDVRLRKTFSSILTAYIFLALIIVLFSETIGLWMVYNKLVIPPDKFNQAVYAFQMSIISTFFILTQIPYSAVIIAKEKMSIYAYMSIFDVSAKLGIAYLLMLYSSDRLIVYSSLMLVISLISIAVYRTYCIRKYPETHYKFIFDIKILKPIIKFSAWNFITSGTYALNHQGVVIMLNLFFAPSIVTARAISVQVCGAVEQFVSNFRTAVNPQIIKRHANNDTEGSKKLVLKSTTFSFFLMMIIIYPILFSAGDILKIWLKEVPPYTLSFVQLALVQSLVGVFNTSYYSALVANGDIKLNAILSGLLSFSQFPIIYLLFKLGFSPLTLSWCAIIVYTIMGIILKPYLLIKQMDYTIKDFGNELSICFRVALLASIVPILLYCFPIIKTGIFIKLIVNSVIIILTSLFFVYLLGIPSNLKADLHQFLKVKFFSIAKR